MVPKRQSIKGHPLPRVCGIYIWRDSTFMRQYTVQSPPSPRPAKIRTPPWHFPTEAGCKEGWGTGFIYTTVTRRPTKINRVGCDRDSLHTCVISPPGDNFRKDPEILLPLNWHHPYKRHFTRAYDIVISTP